eukprot:Colp12_sorted_trinity150504_noHs@26973
MPSQAFMSTRELYGGAITMTLPNEFIDVSQLREVPDNQEVYTHISNDQSVIIELLEYESDIPDEEAPAFHFRQLASANAAEEYSQIDIIQPLSPDALPHFEQQLPRFFLSGVQRVSKFNEPGSARNTVRVHLVLLRLPDQLTDVLITFNDPLAISPGSSSAQPAEPAAVGLTLDSFRECVASLKINDWSLFG